jgi:hypothetical protein
MHTQRTQLLRIAQYTSKMTLTYTDETLPFGPRPAPSTHVYASPIHRPAKLVAHLSFNAGSYVVSPADTLSILSPFQLDFGDGAPIELTRAMTEFPGYQNLYEPALASDMRILRSPTLFTQPFKVNASGDFVASGQAFFVLEPSCVPYALDFTLTQRDGLLALEAGEIHTEYGD